MEVVKPLWRLTWNWYDKGPFSLSQPSHLSVKLVTNEAPDAGSTEQFPLVGGDDVEMSLIDIPLRPSAALTNTTKV